MQNIKEWAKKWQKVGKNGLTNQIKPKTMETREETQEKRILKHLQKGKKITQLQALIKFDCLRLSDRIFRLRKKGYHIETEMIEGNGKRYGEYSMPECKRVSLWQRLRGE